MVLLENVSERLSFTLCPTAQTSTLHRHDVLRWSAAKTNVFRPFHTTFYIARRNHRINGDKLRANNVWFKENLAVVHALPRRIFQQQVFGSAPDLWAVEQPSKNMKKRKLYELKRELIDRRGFWYLFESLTDCECLQLFRGKRFRRLNVVDVVGITRVSHTNLIRYAVYPLLITTVVLYRLSSVSPWVDLETLFRRHSASKWNILGNSRTLLGAVWIFSSRVF